ncbi:DUF72 domain-containing protein [Pseudanabaena catenata USMAC16]|uniref:DUF72 domain-containing protein n=3 Tax=Pseudanabaena TaxID=1152 RepID=L8N451_9CYAN|nr:DUF72 domain-containing protein [Pseudanabaena catenata]ELS33028.1 protein of unknown function DUF72 [Pseudanabaena biceps PCC 7429]MDG3494751.1 DUF72 domain-containing protein [Pseudanabaena catenata USMAC16]
MYAMYVSTSVEPFLENMNSQFYLGCAVWAYKGWVGDFYPQGSRSEKLLQLYSDRLITVEVNSTFYSLPDRQTLERWAKDTHPNFRFCPKFPKHLTHNGLLVPFIEQSYQFLDLISSLGDRLGVVFVQLPPSYSPANFTDLESFLQALPRDQYQIALEVRHGDWFKAAAGDRLNRLLRKLGMGRVLLDSRPIYDLPLGEAIDPALAAPVKQERRKPNLPLQPVVTAPFSIVRFISHPERNFNIRFWQEWMTYLQEWLAQDTQIYFFMHCPLEERSPHNAKYFQEMLEKTNLSVPALPWDRLAPPPQQLKLF